MTVPTRIAEFRHTQAPCLQKSEACCDVAGRRVGVGGSGGGVGAALTAAAALDVLGVAGGCLAAALARGANCGRAGPCSGPAGPAGGGGESGSVMRTGSGIGGVSLSGHVLKLPKQLTEQNARIRSAGRWLRMPFTLSFSHQYATRPSEPHQRHPARIDSGRSKRIRVERANGSRRSWVVFTTRARSLTRRAAMAAKHPPWRTGARDASSELAYAERSAGSSGR